MDAMTLMLRVVGIALASLIALLVLRNTSGGFAVLVRASATILLFGIVIVELSSGISSIRELVSEFIDADSFVGKSLSVMIKALGIALIGRICSDVCRDCGESGLAQGIEATAGVIIFSLSLPILSGILEFAADVLSRGS